MPSPTSEQTSPDRILQRIDWTVIRRLDGILQGDYRSLFYGYGLDLADLREYQPGDDIRYIDWNVTARLDTPYIRQYYEDREITAWFLLDISPSVDFGTAQGHKRDRLIDFVATISRLLTRHGNKVGAILFDRRVERIIPARGGRLHVLRLIHDLQTQPASGPAPLTDLRVLIETGFRAIRRRSLVFVLSDFISAPGWEKPLTMLARRHELLAVQLWDPRERELPDVGMVLMQDSETGEQMWIDTHDPRFRARFGEIAGVRQQQLSAALRRAGADVLSLSTQDDLVARIVAFAAQRRQRKRAVM